MTSEDANHLNLLGLFHYVLGGITALFACFPFIHVAMGIAMVSGVMDTDTGEDIPKFMGWMFIAMGSLFILTGWLLALGMIVAGKKLKRRTSRTFCLVMAGIECMFMPLGTILGVFTIILLMKEPVKLAFGKGIANVTPE